MHTKREQLFNSQALYLTAEGGKYQMFHQEVCDFKGLFLTAHLL